MEKTEIDGRIGRPLNANLARYNVPVNADIGEIDVTLVEEEDRHINSLGAKGIGKIGIVGVPQHWRMRCITQPESEYAI